MESIGALSKKLSDYLDPKKVRQVNKQDIHKEFEDINDSIIQRKSVKVIKINKTIKLTQAEK